MQPVARREGGRYSPRGPETAVPTGGRHRSGGNRLLFRTRARLLASVCTLSILLPTDVPAQAVRDTDAPAALAQLAGGQISAIRVEGNQRIEEGTIRSYMLVQPGDPFDPDRLDRSLKTLYATGLFSDVSLRRE